MSSYITISRSSSRGVYSYTAVKRFMSGQLLSRLQSVLNAAVRLIFSVSKSDHVQYPRCYMSSTGCCCGSQSGSSSDMRLCRTAPTYLASVELPMLTVVAVYALPSRTRWSWHRRTVQYSATVLSQWLHQERGKALAFLSHSRFVTVDVLSGTEDLSLTVEFSVTDSVTVILCILPIPTHFSCDTTWLCGLLHEYFRQRVEVIPTISALKIALFWPISVSGQVLCRRNSAVSGDDRDSTILFQRFSVSIRLHSAPSELLWRDSTGWWPLEFDICLESNFSWRVKKLW